MSDEAEREPVVHEGRATMRPSRGELTGDAKLADHLQTQALATVALLMKKNAAYGSRNIGVYGKTGVQVRLSDKLERMRTLTTGNSPRTLVGDEQLSDTIRDMVGYGLIWLTIDAGWWPGLEIVEDREGGHG